MKINQLKNITLLLPILLLSGCFGVESKKESNAWELATPTPLPAPSPSNSRITEIKISVLSLSDRYLEEKEEKNFGSYLGRYIVSFEVPFEYFETIKIQRWNENTGAFEKDNFSPYSMGKYGGTFSEYLYLPFFSTSASNYRYEVSYGDGLRKTFRISLKPSLKINGEFDWSDEWATNLDLDTLYISPGATLITRGKNIQIRAKTLVSRGGIFSGPPELKPGQFLSVDGGRISLSIEKLIGQLDVHVGKPIASNESNINIYVKELSRLQPDEPCGVNAQLISSDAKPTVYIEQNNCSSN